jgi:hypothetical protein
VARKLVLLQGEGSRTLLTETYAGAELELQETMKGNPDLLPIDEFGMTGPLLVVGRETNLPSGSVDLVAMARGGEILVVEFKVGPKNPDFRAVLAQLVDYGSDMWGKTYEQFESTVPAQYFASRARASAAVKGPTLLKDTAVDFWGLSEEEQATFQDAVSQQLTTGGFHYVVVAQSFSASVLQSIDYFNASMPKARFYAVEMVRFTGDRAAAFECRTLRKPVPSGTRLERGPTVVLDQVRFLDSIADLPYREALSSLLAFCDGLGLIVYWGTSGSTIRTRLRDKTLTLAWVFPPGVSGWMGLTDTTFGYDPTSAKALPGVLEALQAYVVGLSQIAGAKPTTKGNLSACNFAPADFIQGRGEITDAISKLVTAINQGEAQ